MSLIRIIKKFNIILDKKQKSGILGLFILMLIGGVTELLSVSMIIPFIKAVSNRDKIMNKWYYEMFMNISGLDSYESFIVCMAVIMAIVFVLKNVFLMFEYNMQYRFTKENSYLTQCKLLHSYLNRPYEYYLSVNTGELVRILNTDVPDAFNVLAGLLILFTYLIISGMLLISIFVISPLITIVIAIVLMVVMLIINKRIKPSMNVEGNTYRNTVSDMNGLVIEAIQGIKEIKIAERESFFYKKYKKYGKIISDSGRRAAVYRMVPKSAIESVAMGSMFLMVALMVIGGMEFEKLVSILGAVGLAAIRLIPCANVISTTVSTISYEEPILDTMINNLKYLKEDIVEADAVYSDKINIVNGDDSGIELRDIIFRYSGTSSNVLDGCNIKIKTGESVGIVGESGSGKTTAIDVLLGLLTPEMGKVSFNGWDVSEDLHTWHSKIGYIPQMIFMLDGTIRDNIAFGIEEKDISEGRVWEALKESALDEYVRSLPNQLDTEIGERGVKLSGGQRQRIGIARALYRQSDILVLDEATSALDNDTESAIMESINKLHGKKTLIIIAHRLTTIEKCDHVYRITDGKAIKER